MPKNITARPTTDFARENIFNVLENMLDFDGLRALDLFAGTGAVSIELLSRGCGSVTAVEKSNIQYNFIRKVAQELVSKIFDMRPAAIERRLKLRQPIYQETAAYGHMGRKPEVVEKTFYSKYNGDKTMSVELFTWEKLDYVDKVKEAFGL